jgi:hypothetical protein
MKEDSDSNIAYLAGNTLMHIFYIILFYSLLSLLGTLPY